MVALKEVVGIPDGECSTRLFKLRAAILEKGVVGIPDAESSIRPFEPRAVVLAPRPLHWLNLVQIPRMSIHETLIFGNNVRTGQLKFTNVISSLKGFHLEVQSGSAPRHESAPGRVSACETDQESDTELP